MKRAIGLVVPLAVAACAPATVGPRPASVAVPAHPAAGLERVIGQDAAGLIRLFGQPDADVREGSARKLQFQSQFCVLDTYLYPQGRETPRVTYVDAREPDGSGIDRASCVGALTRREQTH